MVAIPPLGHLQERLTDAKGWNTPRFNNVETKTRYRLPEKLKHSVRRAAAAGSADRSPVLTPRLGNRVGVLSKTRQPAVAGHRRPLRTLLPTTTSICIPRRRRASICLPPRPAPLISGKRMDKISWGPNWEELLGGEFEKRARDRNFEAMQKEMYGQFENTFMMYPRPVNTALT